jgi:hypothetical protein
MLSVRAVGFPGSAVYDLSTARQVPLRWRTTVGSKSIAGDAGHNLVAVTFLGSQLLIRRAET